MNKQYFIGMAKQGKTLIIQAVTNKDYLSCELYDYFGLHETTKTKLKENRYSILELLKQQKPKVYGTLKYAIVE